jgi:hypothetical protein
MAAKSSGQQRPVYLITLRAPSDRDAIRLLRAALKTLGRRFGLQCLRVEEFGSGEGEP